MYSRHSNCKLLKITFQMCLLYLHLSFWPLLLCICSFSTFDEIRYVHLSINPRTTMVRMTSSASPMDMVSSIGGTLGLFTGFSILSAAEIVYYVYKYARERASNVKKKMSNNRVSNNIEGGAKRNYEELQCVPLPTEGSYGKIRLLKVNF